MTLFRWLAALAAFACCGLLAPRAQAYPQFTLKGLGDCGSCHHSPYGGGLPNRWGRESLDVAFGKDSGIGPVNDDLTYDEAQPMQLKLDLGADVRLVPLFGTDGDGSLGPTVIPMVTEVGGAAALGRFTVYGTVTAKKIAGSGPSYVLGSREHWLGYHAGTGVDVRLGRMVLPFGIRQPDHTQYAREDFGFDKWDQSYGIEADVRRDGWSLFANVFAGDLTQVPSERQERGVVVTPVLELGDGAALGLSALGSTSTAYNRVAGSLFGRAPLVAGTYVMAEVALQHDAAKDGDETLTTIAEYLRAGWFARPELDVFLEAGHRSFFDDEALTKARLGVGANWQLFNWLEVAPQVFAESRSDLPSRVIGMVQVHLVY